MVLEKRLRPSAERRNARNLSKTDAFGDFGGLEENLSLMTRGVDGLAHIAAQIESA
jgi:hypothetical protein